MKTDGADRVLYPQTGFRKSDVLRYYEVIAATMLPHLRDRPLSFKRYPEDVHGEAFWEKDAPSYAPKWVKTVAVPRRYGGTDIQYVVPRDKRTLAWLVDIGTIELHPFLHTVTNLQRPTHVVFDLDPGPGASVLECGAVAIILRDYLAQLKLETFVKVSGSKGLQVHLPLNTPVTYAETEPFAQSVAIELARLHPRLIVAKMAKTLRASKVFIDWSQNSDFKTTIGSYSLRANRPIPYISLPVEWDLIEQAIRKSNPDSLYFEPDEALKYVKKHGDPFAPSLKLKQRLPAPFLKALAKTPRKVLKEEKGDSLGVIVKGVRLPKPKSQSSRRLFVLSDVKTGNDLWLESEGKFRRWILKPDREEGGRLIAMPAGRWPAREEYFRGIVPEDERNRIAIAEVGTYEVIEGSESGERMRLWFTGHTLQGDWMLEKINRGDASHKSWMLYPRA